MTARNYQVMPPLSDEELEALKADIADHGVLVPVEYDEEGNILDGYHRVQICQELGITEWPRMTRFGMTEGEKWSHARRLNLARRHLTHEQKRKLIEDQLKETPERSDRQIAGALAVSHVTVGVVRSELETGGQIDHLETSLGADGKEYPRQVDRKCWPSEYSSGDTLGQQWKASWYGPIGELGVEYRAKFEAIFLQIYREDETDGVHSDWWFPYREYMKALISFKDTPLPPEAFEGCETTLDRRNRLAVHELTVERHLGAMLSLLEMAKGLLDLLVDFLKWYDDRRIAELQGLSRKVVEGVAEAV